MGTDPTRRRGYDGQSVVPRRNRKPRRLANCTELAKGANKAPRAGAHRQTPRLEGHGHSGFANTCKGNLLRLYSELNPTIRPPQSNDATSA